jgi:type II secretory ATPase GspE/PulE/Tfp pilus assembly ATPase PilB-like protein
MLESKKIDVRVSSLPTFYGENIVLRLLDKTSVSKDLGDLGMEGYTLKEFRRLIRFPHGIILVTGPTGSGKSTTLFAALSEINDIKKNIVTVEDPIEYDIEMVRQTQVNPKIGLTFAQGLRSILRQDPDVIMVGEIRDTETAEIAVQAALTGHLVLSTLHTNDAIGAITRLVDMGIPPYLIASSVIGVLAQRLIRKICPKCKEAVQVPVNVMKELGIQDPKAVFYGGKGCSFCSNQGYTGRSSIHEFFSVNSRMRELITKKASEGELVEVAKQQGMKTLRETGIEKAYLGITSLEEVLEVTRQDMG